VNLSAINNSDCFLKISHQIQYIVVKFGFIHTLLPLNSLKIWVIYTYMMLETAKELEKTVLVCYSNKSDKENYHSEDSLLELKFLAETAGAVVMKIVLSIEQYVRFTYYDRQRKSE
jgi:hypothetical protein